MASSDLFFLHCSLYRSENRLLRLPWAQVSLLNQRNPTSIQTARLTSYLLCLRRNIRTLQRIKLVTNGAWVLQSRLVLMYCFKTWDYDFNDLYPFRSLGWIFSTYELKVTTTTISFWRLGTETITELGTSFRRWSGLILKTFVKYVIPHNKCNIFKFKFGQSCLCFVKVWFSLGFDKA